MDDQAVGVLDLIRNYPQPSDWYLGLLVLVPEARGRGLGCAIVRRVISDVRAEGGKSLDLVVQEQNRDARRFWESQGFQLVRTTEQKLPDGQGNLVHLMCLAL